MAMFEAVISLLDLCSTSGITVKGLLNLLDGLIIISPSFWQKLDATSLLDAFSRLT